MKSLRTGLIEVDIYNSYGVEDFYWNIINIEEFGFGCLFYSRDFKTEIEAKADFEKIAKLNGWRNYKWG